MSLRMSSAMSSVAWTFSLDIEMNDTYLEGLAFARLSDWRVEGFLAAIHERTPTGAWIAVQHHPGGDWSVAERPLPWLPGETAEVDTSAGEAAMKAVAQMEKWAADLWENAKHAQRFSDDGVTADGASQIASSVDRWSKVIRAALARAERGEG